MADERLNILFSSWNYPPRRGGIEEMVRQMFRHLSRLDDVVLLTSHGEPSEAESSQVIRSPWRGLIGYLAWLAGRLPREARERPETVLLSSGALVGCWVELLNLRQRRPHVLQVHGTDVTYPNWLYQQWLRFFIPRVSVVAANSSATREEVLDRGLTDPDRVVVLPPGVDVEMTSLPAVEAPMSDLPVLLFVGRVIPRKGLRPFIERCLPRIQEKTPVELWVIGGEATSSLAHEAGELASIQQWLEGRPEAKHIRFLGEVSDEVLRGVLERARLLILPAVAVAGDVEGFGIVFLEAAAFGVPAVSTQIGGIPEAVLNGVTGILTEPDHWQDFADAVVRLLEDEDLYERLSAQARERVREQNSWPILAQRWQGVLRATAGP